MSITDELRTGGIYRFQSNMRVFTEEELTAIADRIDEWNKADVRCEYARGYTAGFNEASDGCEAADELRERIDSEYVKLPVDADGEVIHIGDNMTNGIDLPANVRRMVLDEHGWKMASVFTGDSKTVLPTDLRHVQPDTWERIIGDALTVGWQNGNWNEVASAEIHERLVERCKRLAGE